MQSCRHHGEHGIAAIIAGHSQFDPGSSEMTVERVDRFLLKVLIKEDVR
jgi:hypothetical protein